MDRYDAIIIGAGIGGGALATVLARAGKSVLVLEKSTMHRDRVRGEWLAPWGVIEAKQLGLFNDLIAAGGHQLARHITYGGEVDPQTAEAGALPLAELLPAAGGPLTIGHPAHCNLLDRLAEDAGATVLRGADPTAVELGAKPRVTYEHGGASHTAECRIVVGADGRGSMARSAAGIDLKRDPNHHLFAGLLVEDAHGWPGDLQAICVEGDTNVLAFPQGNGRVRVYMGYATEQKKRLTGDDSQGAFLDSLRMKSMPLSEHLAGAKAAGPVASYPNEDAWSDTPYGEGVVLIGDAAGWNDPIIGQGLSITYRDVRIVRDILLAGDDWSPAAFAPYGEERRERMRRLRFSATMVSKIENEFGPEAEAKRALAYQRRAENPMYMMPLLAAMLGPETMPPAAFEDSLLDQLLAG